MQNDNRFIVAAALQDHISKRFINNVNDFPILSKVKNVNSYKKPKGKSVIDTGLKKKNPKSNDSNENRKEYVITEHPTNQNRTLAEQMGLIGQIPKTNEYDWIKIKDCATQRNVFHQSCPVCQDLFKSLPTVLLSCSHVFHRQCIESVEKYTNQKICPMCRSKDYQKYVTFEGEKAYRNICAIRIQSTWRGYKEKIKYLKYCKANPPKDDKLKSKWILNKLSDLSSAIIQQCSETNKEAHLIIQESDNTIGESRKQIEIWEAHNNLQKQSDNEWQVILKKSEKRDDIECSICLQKWRKGRARVLVNCCAHVYHKACLMMCEAMFDLQHIPFGRNRQSKKYPCPICRNTYLRCDIDDSSWNIIKK